jgi:hypothetical protein
MDGTIFPTELLCTENVFLMYALDSVSCTYKLWTRHQMNFLQDIAVLNYSERGHILD